MGLPIGLCFKGDDSNGQLIGKYMETIEKGKHSGMKL